ncbi:MAG: hypothetical protein MRZ73_05265 [Pseudoflavonifractor capillosus]|uniref:hypothetical protein n=1 Tax=Pseudoflavonifractor capillosus TaxID=106588 RepID=UPI0023F6D546|nr:hypothetical protein [Pseudoflavonifractor capillosus]MCI5927937.1 hypothetical protein [Pseudoflavonifractor capillosus]
MSSAIKSLSSNAFHFPNFIGQKDTSHNKNSALTGYQAVRKNALEIFEVLFKKRGKEFFNKQSGAGMSRAAGSYSEHYRA